MSSVCMALTMFDVITVLPKFEVQASVTPDFLTKQSSHRFVTVSINATYVSV